MMRMLGKTLLILLMTAVAYIAVLYVWGDVLMGHAVRVQAGAALARDIDHRMKPGEKPGLNADNIRASREADASDKAFNIIFLGDSYVFGFLLDPAEAPPAQLELLLREHYQTDQINVWNFGWISSSPYLSLRLLKDLGDKYRPDLILINVDMTDFKDDYFYRRVIEGQGIYALAKAWPELFFHIKNTVAYVPFMKSWHQRWFGYPYAGDYFIARQPMADSRVYFEAVQNSLDQINEYAQQRWQVPFVAFLSPRHWQYTDREALNSWEKGGYDVLGPYALEPFRYFEAAAPRLTYPLVPLLKDFRETDRFPLSFDSDSHWNPAGARFAAEAIFRHCLSIGCFDGIDERFNRSPKAVLAPAEPELAPVP